MPQCVKCKQFFHPDYCVDAAPGDPDDNAKFCMFCHLNKEELTIEDQQGNEVMRIKKQEAINIYKDYIKGLTETHNIKHLIETGTKSRIIMP